MGFFFFVVVVVVFLHQLSRGNFIRNTAKRRSLVPKYANVESIVVTDEFMFFEK